MSPEPVGHAALGEQAYSELQHDDATPHAHYRTLWAQLRRMGSDALAAKSPALEVALHAGGVTFAVEGDADAGRERVWPFDPIPRIIPAAEWALLEAGLAQRVRALNRFLHDVHHDQHALKDGVVYLKTTHGLERVDVV